MIALKKLGPALADPRVAGQRQLGQAGWGEDPPCVALGQRRAIALQVSKVSPLAAL